MATLAPSPRSTAYTTASATAGPFIVGFPLFFDNAVRVYVNDQIVTGWTIAATFTGGVSTDATVTLAAPTEIGDKVRIDGRQIARRDLDYLNGDPNLTQNMNAELARLWAAVQELATGSDRAIKATVESPPFTPENDCFVVWDGEKFTSGPNPGDIAAAAENAQIATTAAGTATTKAGEAATSATNAATSAATVNLPASPVALSMLRRNAGNTAYEARTAAQVRGDLGISGIGADTAPTITDLNALAIGGVYYAASTATGAPNATENWSVHHQPANVNTAAAQTVTGLTSGRVFRRVEAGGVWPLLWAETISSNGSLAAANSILLRENVNLSPVADNFASPQWPKAASVAGITYAVAIGSDEQGPFVDYRIFGTPTSGQTTFLLGITTFADLINIINGQSYSASCVIERVGGSWAGVMGVVQSLVSYTGANAYVGETNFSRNNFTGPLLFTATRAFTGATEAKASPAIYMNMALNTALDITLRIRGLQLDLGAARRAYRYLPATPAQVRAAVGVPFISRAGRNAAGLTAVEFNDLPVGEVYNFQVNGVSLATGGNLLIQFGTAAGWIATGYNTSSHLIVNTQSNSAIWAANGIVAALGGAALAANGLVTVTRQGDNMGVNGGVDLTVGSAWVRNATCFGGVALATGTVITRARVIATDGGAFDAGTISLLVA